MKEDNIFFYLKENHKEIIGIGTIIMTLGSIIINFIMYLCHALYFQKWNIPMSFFHGNVGYDSLFYLIVISFFIVIFIPLISAIWVEVMNYLLLLLLRNKSVKYRANYIRKNYYTSDKKDEIELDSLIKENKLLARKTIAMILVLSALYFLGFSIIFIGLSILEGNDLLQSFHYSMLIGVCQLVIYAIALIIAWRGKIKLLKTFKDECTKGENPNVIKTMWENIDLQLSLPAQNLGELIRKKVDFSLCSLSKHLISILLISAFFVFLSAVSVPKKYWVYQKETETYVIVFQNNERAILKKCKIDDNQILIELNNQRIQELNEIDLQQIEFKEIILNR